MRPATPGDRPIGRAPRRPAAARATGGFGFAALFLLLALGAALAVDLGSWEEWTERRSLDASGFGSRDLTRILTTLGALHPRPSLDEPSALFEPPDLEPAFGVDPLPPGRIPAALGIDRARVAAGAPSVALLVAPADLAELEENPEERGREWERPGYFALVESGHVRTASLVGVRIHGGGGRRKGRYGFRIYFRRGYGEPRLASGVLETDGDLPPKRVVLRPDGGPGRGGRRWNFVNAIGSDIARRIGLEAAHSRPVAFYLNGEARGIVALVERIDRHYLLAHYGHDDFVQVDTKFSRFDPTPQVKLGDAALYYDLRQWATADGPLSLEEVRQRVDVDNLVRWHWLVQLLATKDALQGALLLDRSDPAARWYWIPWDLDISLGIWTGRQEPAEASRFADWLIPRSWKRDVRTALVGRLLASSDEFRSLYSTTFDEIVNHRLDRSWLDDLIDRYRRESERFEVEADFLSTIERFLHRRPEALREQLRIHLHFGPSHAVRVVAPEGVTIRIGGKPYERPFDGRYVEGSRLRLEIDPKDRELFGAWRYGNRESREPAVEIPVDRPLEVRLITARGVAAATAP